MPNQDWFPAILQAFALPPGLPIALLALALLSRSPKSRRFFLLLGLGILYLTSIPATANWLIGRLERVFPPVSLEKTAAEAIVVLGAGRNRDAPEYGGDSIASLGLERLRYAARLGKISGLPILTSGGCATSKDVIPEAELMGTALQEFGVEARWQEGKSQNTFENALFSSQILKGVGIGEIILVTQAWHMPRAVEAFEKAGMRVVPAPTGYLVTDRKTDFRDFLPSATAVQTSYWALHEMLGMGWYRFRYYSSLPRAL